MTDLGYCLTSELHGPRELVEHARLAEEAGFRFALISDHYHPWTSTQGHSPFVWGVIGGIAQATNELTLGTGVTCPTIRIHPAIVAQAAATASLMLDGRFFLGVGSGENLNEHILGDPWPPAEVRLDMLEEAVAVMRALWSGEVLLHQGDYYVVENARIYDPPDGGSLPVYVAAAGRRPPSSQAASVTASSARHRRARTSRSSTSTAAAGSPRSDRCMRAGPSRARPL
jgi:coenzyme F420-dependent glucose-6-phosphate dehydrogenase